MIKGGNPIELFQLFGIENIRSSQNYNGRSSVNGNLNNCPATGANGNNVANNGPWRIPINVMGPPPMQRPPNNGSMKKGYWTKSSHR